MFSREVQTSFCPNSPRNIPNTKVAPGTGCSWISHPKRLCQEFAPTAPQQPKQNLVQYFALTAFLHCATCCPETYPSIQKMFQPVSCSPANKCVPKWIVKEFSTRNAQELLPCKTCSKEISPKEMSCSHPEQQSVAPKCLKHQHEATTMWPPLASTSNMR